MVRAGLGWLRLADFIAVTDGMNREGRTERKGMQQALTLQETSR